MLAELSFRTGPKLAKPREEMDRIHGSLDFRESYDESTQLMDQSLITVERNCHELRDHTREQRKLIIDSLRANSDNARRRKALQATLNFHDHIVIELVEIEQVCHEYRAKIRAEFAAEVDQRLRPPPHTSLAAVKKAYDLCSRALRKPDEDGRQSMLRECLCQWTNISPYILENAQDIVYGPKRPMPSEFDDSDQKFKQELMILRSKMFSMSPDHHEATRPSIDGASKKEFVETLNKIESFAAPSLETELRKVGTLKFADGEFTMCDAWMRLLDAHGKQLRSKWYLIICPQIERLLKKHRIATMHLSPKASFKFISRIPENGLGYRVSREDLIPLVEGDTDVRWLEGTKMQIRDIDGRDVAATIVQACWRGYWVRKSIFNAECKYIAGSIIWVAWLVVKKKRRMHERYLRNMLTSLDTTRELCLKFSADYSRITESDHVVIHLPSLGFPLDVRRTFGSDKFAIYQNTMALKLSSLRNPRAHVIYVLPVKGTKDLVTMYRDFIESVLPNENAQERMSFVELSQADTFADCSFNVSRTLYCSEETLVTIREKITDKPAFFLPWVMDECDVRLAGNFGLPLLAPDMEMQHQMLNRSYMTDMIDELELEQPPHVTGIKDYASLCSNLAEMICTHTEICQWQFKLNVGLSNKHVGVFLINHMSVPFMPILRKERETHGEEWTTDPDIRRNFLKCLSDHLPGVVSRVTRLTNFYEDWKDFYCHITKYGCLLQAVPNEKSSSYVTVTVFIPGNSTGESVEWTGTADKVCLATESKFSTYVYMMPHSFTDNSHLEPVVEKLTKALQFAGYFGHLYVDLCCFPDKREDKIVTLVIETNPYYGHAQHFFDAMKLSINGSYERSSNSFDAGIKLMPNIQRQKSTTAVSTTRIPSWDETTERYGIAVGQLYNPGFRSYSWKKLRSIVNHCTIKWNASMKQGSFLLLHDGTSKQCAMLMAITPSVPTTLKLMKKCLKKLHAAFGSETKVKSGSNLPETIDLINKLSKYHGNATLDKCDPMNRVQ